MLRKLSFILIAIFAVSGLKAQPRQYDDWVTLPRNEISISYGLISISDFSTIMNNFFPSIGTIEGRPLWATGCINLGYTYRLYENLEVGGMFSYSGNMGNMTERGAVLKNFFSFMPQAKYNWYNKGKVRLYSRLAAGIQVISINNASGNTEIPDKTAASITFQASPIGIEIGRYVAFFAEAGFGAAGVISVGMKKVF